MLKKFETSSTKTITEQSTSFAYTVGTSHGAHQEILKENLNMRLIVTKFVPQLLTNDQKQQHINVCLEP
jgi:hypothetical protein